MTLILDTGPLLAALDRRDPFHAACRQLLESAAEPLCIPAPVLVELDYFARRRVGPEAVVMVIEDVRLGAYRLEDVEPDDLERISDLLRTYSDSDIGFVDASVLAIVERLGEEKLATLDHRHFAMMRPRHVSALRLLPE